MSNNGAFDPETDGLTPGEQHVLALIREGRLDAEIAVRLGVSVGDVKDRIQRILRKLELSERRDLLDPTAERRVPTPATEAEVIIDATGGATAAPRRAALWTLVAKVAALPAILAIGAIWIWSGDSGVRTEELQIEEGVITLIDPTIVRRLVESGTPGVYRLAPEASPTPSPPPAGTVVNGIFLREFTFTGSDTFPESLVLYVFNPGAPEPEGAALHRVYRLGNQTHSDRLFPTPKTSGYLISAAAEADGSDIVVAVCTRGACKGGGDDPLLQTTVYRSRDGGITWETAFVVDRGTSVAAVANGRILVSQAVVDGPERWLLFENGALRELTKPQVQLRLGPERPILGARGEVLWIAGRLLLQDSGLEAAVMPGYPLLSLQPMPSGKGWVAGWSDEKDAPGPKYVAAIGPRGEVMSAYSLPAGAVFPRVWPGDLLGAGNVVFAPGALPGGDPGLPVLIHMSSGSLQVLFEPFRAGQFGGRKNEVVAAIFSSVARVNTPGDCLYIRSAPSADSGILDCAPHGALLIAPDGGLGGPARADSADLVWYRVRTFAGVEGWVSGAYLE